MGPSEDGAFWHQFLRGLVARGLGGVQLVISDAHQGLKGSIAAVLQGASWQRCRVHFVRNALGLVPKAAAEMVAATIRTVFAQPDPAMAREQWRKVADGFRARYPRLAALLDEAEADVLAYLAFPREHWRQIWSNNPLERLNKEIKRRTDVVGIFPNDAAVIRLVGAVLAEQHDEWQVGRRYFSAESLAKLTRRRWPTPRRSPGGRLNDQPVAMWITLNALSHRPTGSTTTRATPHPIYTLDGALLLEPEQVADGPGALREAGRHRRVRESHFQGASGGANRNS